MQLRGRLWIYGLLISLFGCTVADQNSLTNENDIVIEFSDDAFLHMTEDESPNVVLVTIDTLRADYLSAYGGPAYTPNLNQLAEQGWLFKNCYSTSMLTNPSHSSIMTSLFPKDLKSSGFPTFLPVSCEEAIPGISASSGRETGSAGCCCLYPSPAVF